MKKYNKLTLESEVLCDVLTSSEEVETDKIPLNEQGTPNEASYET